MAVFVLVHGAFQGGYVWREVAGELRRAGHEVLTPTLTGLGERTHLVAGNRGLAGYVQDLELAALYEQVEDIVLVGHSWSGLLIPAVAERLPGRVVRLVFVDAVLPEPGKSFADLAGPKFEDMLASHCDGRMVRPWPLPVFGLPPGGEMVRRFAVRLTSMPAAAFREPYAGPDWSKWPHPVFIRCLRTKNPLLADMDRLARERGLERREIDTDHNPMTTDPATLAAVLEDVSGAVLTVGGPKWWTEEDGMSRRRARSGGIE